MLSEAGSLVGASDHGTTKALYAHDPAGSSSVSWLVPADLLSPTPGLQTLPLDLEADIQRYGAQTRGGTGLSVTQS